MGDADDTVEKTVAEMQVLFDQINSEGGADPLLVEHTRALIAKLVELTLFLQSELSTVLKKLEEAQCEADSAQWDVCKLVEAILPEKVEGSIRTEDIRHARQVAPALRAELARMAGAEDLLRRMIDGYDGEADEVGWERLIEDIRAWRATRPPQGKEGT